MVDGDSQCMVPVYGASVWISESHIPKTRHDFCVCELAMYGSMDVVESQDVAIVFVAEVMGRKAERNGSPQMGMAELHGRREGEKARSDRWLRRRRRNRMAEAEGTGWQRQKGPEAEGTGWQRRAPDGRSGRDR
jgi:hypothetical protein